jgi:Tfp pilus assembly protein PilV
MKTVASQRGFSLINIMVTVLVFALGLLALSAVYSRLVGAQTQSQNLTRMAPWGNSFWGVVQANPAILTTMASTYTAENVAEAPAPLQSWLAQILVTAPLALPNGSVTIQTGPDAASGNGCTTTTGCSVTLTISWAQNANPNTSGASITRSQVFYYQFGL